MHPEILVNVIIYHIHLWINGSVIPHGACGIRSVVIFYRDFGVTTKHYGLI